MSLFMRGRSDTRTFWKAVGRMSHYSPAENRTFFLFWGLGVFVWIGNGGGSGSEQERKASRGLCRWHPPILPSECSECGVRGVLEDANEWFDAMPTAKRRLTGRSNRARRLNSRGRF
jgi:hypothetical protein